MSLMFATLDELRTYQEKARKDLRLSNDTLTNIDIYISKMPEEVKYPNCETCGTPIKKLNPDIVPVFSLIPFWEGIEIELKLHRFFLNKVTERFCDLEVGDLLTCECGKNDVTEATNREMMRIVRELTEEEKRRAKENNNENW